MGVDATSSKQEPWRDEQWVDSGSLENAPWNFPPRWKGWGVGEVVVGKEEGEQGVRERNGRPRRAGRGRVLGVVM